MRKFTALALALTLVGCSWKVGPDYQKPEITPPKQWRFADKEARDYSNTLWWQQFNDPVLNRLVEEALRNNYDVKVAIANVEKFVGMFGSTRSNLFPQIGIFGQYDRHQSSGQLLNVLGGSGRQFDFARLGSQMNWELDIWGQLRRANEAAMAELLGQVAVQRGVILSLVSDLAVAYVQLRTYDKQLEITQNVVHTLEEDLKLRTIRFQEGFTSQLEVEQAKSELERRSALIPLYEQKIAETEHAICLLLGKNPGPVQRGKDLDELVPYLSGVKKGVKSMSELIEFNKKNADKAMPYFKQELVEMSNAKGDLKSNEYLKALATSTSARGIIDSTMQKYQLDAIVGTSYGPAHCIDWVNGDYDPGFYFCPPAAMAGYPHITVPMGDIHGLPVGLSFIASKYEEGKIIGLAYAFEQATKHRKVPRFKRSI